MELLPCIEDAKKKVEGYLISIENRVDAAKAAEKCKRLLDDLDLHVNIYVGGLSWDGVVLSFWPNYNNKSPFEDVERILNRLIKDGYIPVGKTEKEDGSGRITWKLLATDEAKRSRDNKIVFHTFLRVSEEHDGSGCLFVKKGERTKTETVYEIVCPDSQEFYEKTVTGVSQ